MQQLRFDNVSLCYKTDNGKLVAIDGLDFLLEKGQSIAIIGPSGCGKSSLLRLACGLCAPSAGKVSVDGVELVCPRKETALILQDFGLLPWKTVRKNAELGLKVRKVARAERIERAAHALELVGLSEFADSYPSQLSGGMRQRLALARSLALDVDLLLMDEPLSALDALLREQMQDTLFELWQREGYAQVLVTHSIEEAVFLGRRILVMTPRPGKIIGQITNSQAGTEGYRATSDFYERCNEVRAMLHDGAAAMDEFDPHDFALGTPQGNSTRHTLAAHTLAAHKSHVLSRTALSELILQDAASSDAATQATTSDGS